MSERLSVLIVEDNPADVDLIRESLPETGLVSFRIESVSRLSEALARLKNEGIDLVLLDLGLPDSQGLETFLNMREAAPHIPALILTGNNDQELAVVAVKEGAQDYLVKGQTGGGLLARAALYAVERKRVESQREAEIEEMRISREFIETVLNSISDSLIVIDTANFTILEANKAFTNTYKLEKDAVIGKYCYELIHNRSTSCTTPDYNCPLVETLKTGKTSTVEHIHFGSAGNKFFCEVSAFPLSGQQGKILKIVYLVRDITFRKQAERRQFLSAEILDLLNDSSAMTDTINCILTSIKREMGLEAVGIRLRSGDDFPYFVQNGFSDDFLLTENTLAVRTQDAGVCRDKNGNISLECMCGLVISGQTDPTNPLFTEGGSFWTNDSLPLLDLTSDQDPRFHPRNRCIHEGFRSVALIPIRTNHEIAGLLQLNDPKKDCFTLDMIHYFEGLGSSIGIALNRKQAEIRLKESQARYQSIFEATGTATLIVADDTTISLANNECLPVTGYSPEELIGTKWTNYVAPESLEIMLKSHRLRREEPGKAPSKYEVRLLNSNGEMRNAILNISMIPDTKQSVVSLLDITDLKRAEELLLNNLNSLRRAFSTTIQVLVSAVEIRDPYTAGHQTRSADLACAIATEMGLPQCQIDGIRRAASIHDIGKLSIPAEILSKPKKLSAIEFSLIKEHAQKGYEMLKDVESAWPLAEIAYQHHERMDGSGYPRNLKGEEICLEARILAVADVVEAMASHRPYRPALGMDAALEEIEKNRGTQYDSAVVEACLRLIREKGFHFESQS